MEKRYCAECSRPISDLCDECQRDLNEEINLKGMSGNLDLRGDMADDERFQYHLKIENIYEVPLWDLATLVNDQNLMYYEGCLFFHFVVPDKTVTKQGVMQIYEYVHESYYARVGEYHRWVVLNDRTNKADYIDNIYDYEDLRIGAAKPIRVVKVPDHVAQAVYEKITSMPQAFR